MAFNTYSFDSRPFNGMGLLPSFTLFDVSGTTLEIGPDDFGVEWEPDGYADLINDYGNSEDDGIPVIDCCQTCLQP